MECCAICREPLLDLEKNGDDVPELKSLRCSHLLHNICWQEWTNHNKDGQCPVCRRYHSIWSYLSLFMLVLIFMDAIKLFLLSIMIMEYWQYNTLKWIYLYIGIDVLFFIQILLCVSNENDIVIELHHRTDCANANYITDMLKWLHCITFICTVIIYILQLRFWLSLIMFMIYFILIALSSSVYSIILEHSMNH